MRQFISILAACAALCASAVQAQTEQTPEGAIRFLQTLAAEGLLLGGAVQEGKFNPETQEVPDNDVTRIGAGKPRRIVRFEIINNCNFSLTFDTPLPYSEKAEGNLAAAYYTPKALPPILISLRSISSIKVFQNRVNLSGSGSEVRFRAPDGDMNNRVAYAFEYLRERCDPTSDTGF